MTQDKIATTVGIDFATAGGVIGVCTIDWLSSRVEFEVGKGSTTNGLDSEGLASRISSNRGGGGWVAIDAPFGLPTEFVDSVSDGTGEDPDDDGLVRRATETHLAQERRLGWPMSPVSSMITVWPLRCSRILRMAGVKLEGEWRLGLTTQIVETYPAAALRLWVGEHPPYRGSGAGDAQQQRDSGIDLIHALLDRFSLDATRDTIISELSEVNHGSTGDAVDALVCALVARQVASTTYQDQLNELLDADAKRRSSAVREGWIHVPDVPARGC